MILLPSLLTSLAVAARVDGLQPMHLPPSPSPAALLKSYEALAATKEKEGHLDNALRFKRLANAVAFQLHKRPPYANIGGRLRM